MPVYLDHHATTPTDPRVVEAMLPYFTTHFGNAGSLQHSLGMRAGAAVELARERVAELIGAQPHEIVFTSGATESDNLAILGVADAHPEPGHIVTVATEHKAVLDPIAHLVERHGWRATVLRPDPEGLVTAEQVAEALEDDTALVSIMIANNEIGVIQPIASIARVCRDRGVLLHTDAAQATGKIPIDAHALGIDLMSLTAHKTHGPKGIGALWIRAGRPRVRIRPRTFGGGQERGLRSGTQPVALIVAMGKTMELAAADIVHGEPARLRVLRDQLLAGLMKLGGVEVHGSMDRRLPNNLLVSFDGLTSTALLSALRQEVACSAGSACSTTDPRPSHVLEALGVAPSRSLAVARFGLGRPTTAQDIDKALSAIHAHVPRLRSAHPGRPR